MRAQTEWNVFQGWNNRLEIVAQQADRQDAPRRRLTPRSCGPGIRKELEHQWKGQGKGTGGWQGRDLSSCPDID